jgi:catechol-2,3-dioxygenase
MSITGISHVSITVADLERSKQWYQDVLEWKCLIPTTSPSSCSSRHLRGHKRLLVVNRNVVAL